ncbi:MAG: acyl--CoA ligase [Candidatus Helarchaeota archaeon]|nr:acyl--CoA ligase [Candidatus Helarchaeota archaeon]
MVRLGKFKEAVYIKARYYPRDRPAIIYGNDKISWYQLNSRINKLANALRKLGIKKGDKVAFLFYNSPQFLETNLAIQELGAIPVPVNFRYVASEIEFLLNNSDSVAFIFDTDALPEFEKIRKQIPKVKYLIHDGPNTPPDMLNYESLIQQGKDKEIKVDLDTHDTAVIIYTGGTTGRPKGVMLSYDNILFNEESAMAFLSRLLPPVSELDDPRFAKNELQRRLLVSLKSLTGIPEVFFEDPKMRDKVIVVDTPSRIGPSLTTMTYAIREGKLKAFMGVPPEGKYHGTVKMAITEQLRELANFKPLSYSSWGRFKLIFKMLKLMLTGGVKVTGEKEVSKALSKAMRSSSKEEEVDKTILVPPLFHLASYAVFLISWMFQGYAVVFLKSKKFNATELLEMIEREKLKQIFLVPTMWKWLIDAIESSPRKFDLSSVAICLTGAAVLHGSYKRKLLQYFPNAIIVDAFGQSEMAPVATMKIDGNIEEVQDRCVGTLLDGMEMKVVDENNKLVAEGQVGEVCYKGASVMQGYYKDEEKTKQAIDAEGFLHSGDLGYMKDGQFYVLERKKECINTGGEKVFPVEVEEVLLENPNIAEACVIGVPDEKWGETIRAVVVLKEGKKVSEDEVINMVEGKIAGFKKPRSVIFATELPVSPVGKILRAKIRELYGAAAEVKPIK